jgi:hypothetical protein
MPPINENVPVRFSDELPESVDVVVIGGGVAGTATAYSLAERGERVLLCEKGRIAGEQSSRNWGWIRQQGRDYAELPIMMESNRIWRGLAEKNGDADLTFTESGCLYLAATAADMQKYETWHDMAKQHQLDTQMLTHEQLQSRYPGIEGKWLGGMVTPSDGRGEPFGAIPALARAAQRAGVAITENCAVRTLDIQDQKVAGVFTEKGRVACLQQVRGLLISHQTWASICRNWPSGARSAAPKLRQRYSLIMLRRQTSEDRDCASAAGWMEDTHSPQGISVNTIYHRSLLSTSRSF